MLYGLILSTAGFAITLVIKVPIIIAPTKATPYFLVFLNIKSTRPMIITGMTKFSSPNAVKNLATNVKKVHCIAAKNLNTAISKP